MSGGENRSRPAPAGSGTGGGDPLADSGAGAGFEAVLAAAAYHGIGGLAPRGTQTPRVGKDLAATPRKAVRRSRLHELIEYSRSRRASTSYQP